MAIAPGPGPTKSKIQNPNSKRPVWILDFGFRILDFGFWILDFGFRILDFGFWILDQFSLRSFCGGPKRPRLDFGFWISDFGFWILDYFPSFGSCIRYVLVTPARVGGFLCSVTSKKFGAWVSQIFFWKFFSSPQKDGLMIQFDLQKYFLSTRGYDVCCDSYQHGRS